MRHDSGAVDDAVTEVTQPSALHDGQRAQYQHTADFADAHKVVCCPQSAQRLACSRLAEYKRLAVERQEL